MFQKFLQCLRIVVAIQCVGIGGRYLISHHEQESSIYGLLFFDWGWQEATAQAIDDLGGWLCLLAAIVMGLNFAFGVIFDQEKTQATLRRRIGDWELPCLVFVTIWFFTLATAEMIRGGVYTEWAIPEQAVRIVSPLVLAISLAFRNQAGSLWFTHWVSGVLQIAIAATFMVHGFKAIVGYGPFVDLILLSDAVPFLAGMSQAGAERILWVIGWLDVILAVSMLGLRWRSIALYMAFWGFVTAASRMLALGLEAWPESLIRAANGGAPLALCFLFQHLKQVKISSFSRLPEELPEEST